jgi:hypothetical protein
MIDLFTSIKEIIFRLHGELYGIQKATLLNVETCGTYVYQ